VIPQGKGGGGAAGFGSFSFSVADRVSAWPTKVGRRPLVDSLDLRQ